MRLPVHIATFVSHTLFVSTALAQSALPEPPPPPPPPLVNTAPSPVPAPMATPQTTARLVRVELPAMDRHAKLEAYDPRAGGGDDDDESWRALCPSPCAVSVPVGTRLRVNGDFRESPAFLAQDRPTMRLVVEPARSGVRLTGILLAAGGGTVTMLSALLYGDLQSRPSHDSGNLTRGDAVGLGVFGAAVMGVGIGLAAWHWKTRVSVVRSEVYGVPLAKGVFWGPGGIRF